MSEESTFIRYIKKNQLVTSETTGEWFIDHKGSLRIGIAALTSYEPVYEIRKVRRLWILWKIDKDVIVDYRPVAIETDYIHENRIIEMQNCHD